MGKLSGKLVTPLYLKSSMHNCDLLYHYSILKHHFVLLTKRPSSLMQNNTVRSLLLRQYNTKIGTIQRRLACLPLDETQNPEAFHIFKKKKEK